MQVGFLHQDEIVESICAAIASKLQGANASRTFQTQTLLPLAPLTPAGGVHNGMAALGLAPLASIAGSSSSSASSSAAGGAAGGGIGAGGRPFDAAAERATALAIASKPRPSSGAGDAAMGNAEGEGDGLAAASAAAVVDLDGRDDASVFGSIGTEAFSDVAAVMPSATELQSTLAGAAAKHRPNIIDRSSSPSTASSSSSAMATTAPHNSEIDSCDLQPMTKLRTLAAPGSRAIGAGAGASGAGSSAGTSARLLPAGAASGGRGSAGVFTFSALAPNKAVRTDASNHRVDAWLVAKAPAAASVLSNSLVSSASHGGAAANSSTVGSAAGGTTMTLLMEGGDVDDGNAGADVIDLDADEETGDGARDRAAPRQSAAASAGQAPSRRAKRSREEMRPVTLTSVHELLSAVAGEKHEGLAHMMRRHVFVGVVDRHLSLLQFNTKLLLVNHAQMARELFYQQVLRLFSNARSFELQPHVDVAEVAMLALDANGLGEPGDREALAQEVAGLLASKADMLAEYFSIHFSISDTVLNAATAEGDVDMAVDGSASSPSSSAAGVSASTSPPQPVQRIMLTHLPRLVDGHTPLLIYLPDFILTLAYNVDWSAEKECFHTVAQAIAAFYAQLPSIPRSVLAARGSAAAAEPSASSSAAASSSGTSVSEPAAALSTSEAEVHRSHPDGVYRIVEQVLMPACRLGLTPPTKLARNHHVVQVACTEQLYRIFERC